MTCFLLTALMHFNCAFNVDAFIVIVLSQDWPWRSVWQKRRSHQFRYWRRQKDSSRHWDVLQHNCWGDAHECRRSDLNFGDFNAGIAVEWSLPFALILLDEIKLLLNAGCGSDLRIRYVTLTLCVDGCRLQPYQYLLVVAFTKHGFFTCILFQVFFP